MTKETDEITLSKTVDEFVSPSPLHLLLAFNHLLKHFLFFFPPAKYLFIRKWLSRALKSPQKNYFGGTLEGNQCRDVLDSTDYLRFLVQDMNVPPLAFEFVNAFENFKKIKNGCFSTKLDPAYPTYFHNFKESIMFLQMNTGYSFIPRFHDLFAHTKPWLDKNQTGLALVSESGAEQFHSKFKKFFRNFVGKDSNSPHFLRKLKNAFDRFNALSLFEFE